MIRTSFGDYLNDGKVVLVNEDLSITPQKCMDTLIDFARRLNGNYRVLEVVNQRMQQELQNDIENQLNELNSQDKLDNEFKQFYHTLANFNQEEGVDQGQVQVPAQH